MITSFRGPHDWASNFYYKAPFVAHNMTFKSSEHYFACFKTLNAEWCRYIIDAPTAAKAKRRGSEAPLRADWKDVRIPVMANALWYKFTQHPDIQTKLLNTHPQQLVEGNRWHDNFWGDCNCNNVSGRHPECLSEGKNALGFLLMAQRDTFYTVRMLTHG